MRFIEILLGRQKYYNNRKAFLKFSINLFLLIFPLIKPQLIFAITFPDMKMNATPNPIGSGARALGIGGAFIATADDATAASWNPAALLNLKKPEISIVGSHFAGDITYNTSIIEGEVKDFSPSQKHLNYFSVAYPFVFFQRNIAFSINYQHLYEFSQNTLYKWRYSHNVPGLGTLFDIAMESQKKQKGSLNTISPSIAVEIIPFLYFGYTYNFWLNEELNDYWENLNIVQGEGKVGEQKVKIYAELYERYDFSGQNKHIGLLWRLNRWFTLGGCLKTQFKANIKHTYRFLSIEEYPQNLIDNAYNSCSYIENLTLTMPASYSLGLSIRFTDTFLVALDVHHTRWQDYLLGDSNGNKISPINYEPKSKANIKPTTQVRLGAEYILVYPSPIISIRSGLFYDPEPASGHVDNFYGVSVGTGITFPSFAFDIAYQYRFGEKKRAEDMLGEKISSDIKQHYIYSSVIFYF